MKKARAFDLICFDVDGTLVSHPSGMVIWEVLNLRYGGSQGTNQERYRAFHEGRLTYPEWVRLDVEGWIDGGATRKDVLEAVAEFRLIDGAREVVHELKSRGYTLGVISGTLNVVLDSLFSDHPFDEVYTNKIFFDDTDKLTGWQATPFDVHGKPDALRDMADRHGIPLERCAYVGDGENDVPLLGVTGFFVAYQPKSERLAQRADIVLKDDELSPLLDIF